MPRIKAVGDLKYGDLIRDKEDKKKKVYKIVYFPTKKMVVATVLDNKDGPPFSIKTLVRKIIPLDKNKKPKRPTMMAQLLEEALENK